MEDSTFSPSPWFYNHFYVVSQSGMMVADCVTKENHSLSNEEKVANAHLIAASPDLLAALRELFDISINDDHRNHFRVHDAEEAARKAIAKALGQS